MEKTKKQHLNESIDSTLERLYSLLREYDIVELMRFVSDPFSNWPAYKLGLIDNKGKILRIPKTHKEKVALQPLVVMLLDWKKQLYPSFKNASYGSYIQGLNRVQLRDKKVFESTEFGLDLEGEIPTDVKNALKSYKISSKLFKKLQASKKNKLKISGNMLPESIQLDIGKHNPNDIVFIDINKNTLCIKGDDIKW